jgi:hypothetical protein
MKPIFIRKQSTHSLNTVSTSAFSTLQNFSMLLLGEKINVIEKIGEVPNILKFGMLLSSNKTSAIMM